MKAKKRIMPILVTVLMVFAMMPVTAGPAFADEETAAIQLVADGAAPNIKGKQESSVWFGNYLQNSDENGGFNDPEPIKWRVLQNEDRKLFLLSDQNLDCKKYNDSETDVTWETSSIRAWLNGYFKDAAFSTEEAAAINETTVVNEENPAFGTPGGNNTEDKVFLLSLGEARNTSYGFTRNSVSTDTRVALNTDYTKAQETYNTYSNGAGEWWLRSPGSLNSLASFVGGGGILSSAGESVDRKYGVVRPAFNLELESVLFTSAAEGGKHSGDAGPDALKAQSDQTNSGNEWKVTLRSGHDSFGISECRRVENGVTVKYNGAAVSTAEKPEYISAVIADKPVTDSSARITYYGRIQACTSDSGAVTINTAGKLRESDVLYVFNEQYNGDKKTDYSSALQEVTIPTLTITARDKTYQYNGEVQGPGDKAYEDPAEIAEMVAVSGLQDGDELTSIIVDGQAKDIGVHEDALIPSGATVNGVSASVKYDVTYVPGDIKITDVAPVVPEYTVTFVDGLGKTLKTQKVESGKAATAPAAPKRSGYTFTGWDKDFSKVTGNMTITARWKKDPAPAPKPAPTPTPKPAPGSKVSGTLLTKMTAKGRTSLCISWSKVTGADGYDIFFSRCNNHGKEMKLKKVKAIKGNKAFEWTKKSLKKKTAYKAVVKAYVMKNGRKSYVRTSPTVHAYTSGGTKRYTNPKSVTVKKTSVSLKAGRTYRIKASVRKLKRGRKLMPSGHDPKLRYLSSNKKIARVSSSGKIYAKAKGSCRIYVYAVNGVSKTVKLTVR